MKFLIILHSTCTGQFSGGLSVIGVLDFCLRGEYPPDLLFSSGSGMCYSSENIWRIIPLLLYSVTVSGCEAL